MFPISGRVIGWGRNNLSKAFVIAATPDATPVYHKTWDCVSIYLYVANTQFLLSMCVQPMAGGVVNTTGGWTQPTFSLFDEGDV